jgi:putative DNA primase/helicase
MTTRDAIIQGLGGNPHTGMCSCPAHADNTPSLKVSEGERGKVLFKCFAGCTS